MTAAVSGHYQCASRAPSGRVAGTGIAPANPDPHVAAVLLDPVVLATVHGAGAAFVAAGLLHLLGPGTILTHPGGRARAAAELGIPPTTVGRQPPVPNDGRRL